MAKKSKIVREFHLQKKVQRHFELRKELRAIIKNPNVSDEEKEKAVIKMQKLPRSSSASRLTKYQEDQKDIWENLDYQE